MTIRDRVRSAIPRIADALALAAMALRAPTAPAARMTHCEHPTNQNLSAALERSMFLINAHEVD
jgi:hypothetical protein